MSLDADDDKAPTLTALAENLPFSLEEIKQVIPENIVEKIGATAFYRLNISIDTAEKSLSIEGVAKLFGELLVSISLNVSQVGGKPSLRFSTYVSVDDPLFLDDLLKLLGVDTAGEMIPHIALNLEEIDFDQEQKHFFIKSSIQSSTGKSELALDINFEAGLTLDFSAHSEKDAYVSLGDIAGPFLTKELNTLTTQGFLPAKINKNLQNSGLLDLQFNLDTAAKSLSFYAEGTVLGMSGQVWFSILPFMGQSMASFQIYCTNKPTSIPGIMKNMLGITIDKTIESYLPKMQLALRELSFDQLDKSFRLAGVIAQESYEVQAGLDIQWSEGVRVDLSLEADEEKPPTLTALAENLPFSLAGIKQVIPGKIVEKIGATAFYGLTVNIDTAEKSFSIEGAAKLFGELLVIASLRYFEEDDHRYLALNASIHEEPVSIREFPGLIGLAGPDEKPGWLDIIPDFKMDIEEFNFDQQEKYFSLNGMIGFDDRKAVTEFRLEKIAKGVIIHIGFEADPEKPPSLISLLGAVIPGISASDIHLPGNMDIMLRTLDLSLDTANKNLGGIALGEIIITGVPVFLSAESKGPDVPWTFKVHSQPTKAISLTGLITNILNISKIELPMKLADVVISNIDLSITPASGEFKFAGQSSMAVPVAAAGTTLNTTLGIDIKRESSKAKPRGKLNGTLKYKEINFTLDLELAEKATLTASAKNLNLSEIAEKLTGTKLPGEVPDLVIKELTLEITSQKELHIYGKVELKQTSTGKKVMEVGTTKFPLGSLEFDFTRTKTKTTCSIAVKGENVILTGDIKFNEFSFSFNYHQTQGWKLAGNVKTTIL
ncbi:MAG: hypothetical protein GTO02_20350, partial [Candidatus Dadabacteria bacterium]|nr:hypothetical protein [Nitrososphaeria archaeon]NIQ16648.1 hypothetical protein [Candidatus Dadabacteria bacterium]